MSDASEDSSSRFSFRRLAGELDFFPLRKTARQYNGFKASNDMRAALNVALLAFPQGMAYAAIAGLPLHYGIFGSIIASVVGMFFAGSKFIVLGPTNATSVMVLSSFATLGIAGVDALKLVPTLIVLVGLLLTIGAYARIAVLIQYVSRTVITGYITAAASLIIANQLRKTLGFDFTPEEKLKASSFIDTIYYSAKHLVDTQWPSLALSLVTALIYCSIKKFAPKLPNVAITLIASSLLAYSASETIPGFQVKLLPALNLSEWNFVLPQFDLDTINMLLPPAIAIALLCVLEGNSIGKSLAAREGARLNGNQEMFSAGMANIACGLFSGMAASGSLTRSQLNVSSGASTPLSSLYSGILLLVGAYALGNFIQFVPTAALAVVVIAIGISLISKRSILLVTRTTTSDRITFYVTFITGLVLALDLAIYLGAVCSILLFIKKVAHPEIVEYKFDESGQLGELEDKKERNDPEVSIVHVEGELFFGATELFRNQIRRVCDDPNLKIVVMKLRNAHNLDATSCMALEELIKYMNEHERILLMSEVRPDTMRILKNSRLIDVINPINLFADESNNPTLSTAKALKRAKEIIGDREAKVSIYAKQK
ncbi:SulP family inorganic anion transporter [Puniceicoccaceae bacterium K14]|nr:SulP family inorganic anion transporter [Puniceicoccaceae bacterium K14]